MTEVKTTVVQCCLAYHSLAGFWGHEATVRICWQFAGCAHWLTVCYWLLIHVFDVQLKCTSHCWLAVLHMPYFQFFLPECIHGFIHFIDLEGKRFGRFLWNLAGTTILGYSRALEKIGPHTLALSSNGQIPPRWVLHLLSVLNSFCVCGLGLK